VTDAVDDTDDVLRRFVDALEDAGVPYMLTGSFASSYYGHGRGTQDIDFVIMPTREQLRALVASFPDPAFYVDMEAASEALRDRGQFNVIDRENAYKADFIIQKEDRFNQEEFNRRVRATVSGVPLTIATAEDVILSKLEWSRLGGSLRQIEDARGILELRADQLDRAYIEGWVERLGLQEQWAATVRSARISS
jgi:hypothetical protein